MGCVPVSWACCAMRTDESRKTEEGLGSMDVRFGAVEERRSGAGRALSGCADMSKLHYCSWSAGIGEGQHNENALRI